MTSIALILLKTLLSKAAAVAIGDKID